MTNLTSEQYRDVLKHVPNATEEIPNVQNVLRRAVQTFFKRFGGYPRLAGAAPGTVGVLGEQIQFDNGVVVGLATPMVTVVVGRRVPGKRFTVVTSADVGKPHKVSFSFSSKRPLGPGCPKWLNCIKGVIDAFGGTVPPFEAAYETSIPGGDAFAATASLEVAFYTFLEILVGRKANSTEKAEALQTAEKKFGTRKLGLANRLASISAEDRCFTIVDCKTKEVLSIPFNRPKVRIVAVDARLNFDQYDVPETEKYLKKACEILGIESFRLYRDDEIDQIEEKLTDLLQSREEEEEEGGKTESDTWTPEDYNIMIKRAKYYLMELHRIREGIQAWAEGDFETFGQKMTESHQSLKENFDLDNPVFDFLVNASLKVQGVFGSKMTGLWPGFGIVSLVKEENIEQYCNYITEKFTQNEEQLSEQLREALQNQKEIEFKKRKKLRSYLQNMAGGSAEQIQYPGADEEKRENENYCQGKEVPCIEKMEKKGRCGTWAHFQELHEPSEKTSDETEEVGEGEYPGEVISSVASEVPVPKLKKPNFYIISPFAGARMMFVTKFDLLRSAYSEPLPHPKELARYAVEVFGQTYSNKVEVISLSPGSLALFGQFMEYHLGHVICLTLPMYVVTVGGKNDDVFCSVKTTKGASEKDSTMKLPVPSVRNLQTDSREWANLIVGVLHEFKGHVPGFNAVVHSSIPLHLGFHSCGALLSSAYNYLEHLTKEFTTNYFEKVERCQRSEYDMSPKPLEIIDHCSNLKYFPIFFSKEGHLTLIDCKKSEITTSFFDDPSYVFLIAVCKTNTTNVTLESLEQRLKDCMQAINMLGRVSLLNLDLKHLKCLKKKKAPGEVIKRAKYVITEHQRTISAIKAIREEDYHRVGALMCQSHASLRDDYEISSPEIDELYQLAMEVEGVLGAKMVGLGLNAVVVILVNIFDVENCIRHIRKNYKNKHDKPVFFITKPAEGAFSLDPKVDMPYIV